MKTNEMTRSSSVTAEFTCEICAKTFKSKSYLRSHAVIHNEVRDKYNCEICSAEYIEKRSLKTHMTIHHI